MVSVDQTGWKPAFAPPQRFTECDRGLVERPLLAPHLTSRTSEDGSLLLASETASILLVGELYRDLVPLLEGTLGRREIIAELSGRHSALSAQTAMVSLAAKGCVVSADFAMDRASAAFWCAQGATPRWAERRIGAARIAVSEDDGRLGAALQSLGLTVGPERPTLSLVVTDDYLDDAHAQTNRKHLESGVPWALVKPSGVFSLFGPVFRPGAEDAPCWDCLASRIGSNVEIANYLRGLPAGFAFPSNTPDCLFEVVIGLAALESAKWIVFGEGATLHRHTMALEALGMQTSIHPVARRPQCRTCGDPALFRLDRPASPVRLAPSPKPVRTSGGFRAVPPQDTLRRYRHLVSPVTGAVNRLLRITDDRDSWLHVHVAGANLALQARSLPALRTSIRSLNSGKGSTPEQAEASALCEAIERHSGAYRGDEIRRRSRFVDFRKGEAIRPETVLHYSDWQYDHAAEINALKRKFAYVPARFDPTVEMSWSPVWSLTQERHRYLPTGMLYFSMPQEHDRLFFGPDTNGCAAGNTLEEAILQGFLELVERDAFACWWYNRLRRPAVALDSFDDPYLSEARDYYAACNRDLWMIDVTHDLGIPVFAAVSRRTDKDDEDILFAAGAHLDPRIAGIRAVCELNQQLTAVRDVKADGSGYLFDDPESLWWWKHARLTDHPYLVPDSTLPERRVEHYPALRTSDTRTDVEHCRSLVENLGMEFLVLDQTRPDIGMPVARTLVPGMRHFWARFAPGRLYQVPVKMGWLDRPTPEADLNPIAVFV